MASNQQLLSRNLLPQYTPPAFAFEQDFKAHRGALYFGGEIFSVISMKFHRFQLSFIPNFGCVPPVSALLIFAQKGSFLRKMFHPFFWNGNCRGLFFILYLFILFNSIYVKPRALRSFLFFLRTAKLPLGVSFIFGVLCVSAESVGFFCQLFVALLDSKSEAIYSKCPLPTLTSSFVQPPTKPKQPEQPKQPKQLPQHHHRILSAPSQEDGERSLP